MEEPIQILVDALAACGWEWDKIVLITAGISHPLGILDMAEWVAYHPKATWQELMKEKVRLIEKYLINM